MRALLLWLVIATCIHSATSKTDRQPGTLLLTMLIKNEEVHLSRSLPKWAPLIDYWIIGIDSNNTDDSEQVIHKHLGHIPGEIMVVDFDGMGPTWTKIVERGLEAYPNATHGILSDADFTPTTERLDKMELDVRCSKHMFSIRSREHTVRKMDWIYRNIPGVKVERRTHQAVKVPELPGDDPYQTFINLQVDEYTGGYQDRSANKSGRYIHWLLKDLEEMPGDERSIYYLGHAHLELWEQRPDFNNADSVYHLHISLAYFRQRAGMRTGYYEERWFAMSKAAELCERYLADYECSIRMWKLAQKLDFDRVDTFFYLAQHYNLAGDPDSALREIKGSLELPTPTRSLFMWEEMYGCLRYREMARAVHKAGTVELSDWKLIKRAGKKHKCRGPEADEVNSVVALASKHIKRAKSKEQTKSGQQDKDVKALRNDVNREQTKNNQGAVKAIEALRDWSATYIFVLTRALSDAKHGPLADNLSSAIDAALELDNTKSSMSCQNYLEATRGFFEIFTDKKQIIRNSFVIHGSIGTSAWLSLAETTLDMWPVCRI